MVSQVDIFPRLAVTMGDPAGIGAEVILKALANPSVNPAHFTVIGSRSLLFDRYHYLLEKNPPISLINPENLSIFDVPVTGDINLGQESAITGKASFQYLEIAISECLKGNFQGIVTAPIAKSAWKKAGYNYPGQTELLAEKAGVNRFGMLFVARSPHTNWILRTLLATVHIPLSQVPQTLTPELLTKKLDLLIETIEKDFGIKGAKIAIAGLNPHSGEQGQLGTEETHWINNWLITERQKRPHIKLDGLIPPDTMWVNPGQAWFYPEKIKLGHDGYLALYHDQGLIPVKLMAFDRAVNTTIGLPFIRTSPDHGTAFDIATKCLADPSSMIAAMEFGLELAQQK
jgi:4-hydroxythreonine-4-phosphate dehydrogenase